MATGQSERADGFRARDFTWVLVIAAIVLIGRLTPFEPVQDFFNSFSWLTKKALVVAKELFESYGYPTIFLAPLLENTIFLGAIIPGTLVMMLGGLSAHDGLIALFPAIPLAIAGAWIGDTISYGIGRFGWQRLGPESGLVRRAEGMREPLLEHSGWLILLYHFAGYSRLIGPAASGFLRVPFRRWMVLDYAGSALWVVVFVMLGYVLGVFGLSLDATDDNVRVVEIILFALAVIGVTFLMTRTDKRRASEGEREEATAAAGEERD
jgi:membrane protein DedA with SNARE-associated domain